MAGISIWRMKIENERRERPISASLCQLTTLGPNYLKQSGDLWNLLLFIFIFCNSFWGDGGGEGIEDGLTVEHFDWRFQIEAVGNGDYIVSRNNIST